MTQKELSEKLSISRQTLARKMKKDTCFARMLRIGLSMSPPKFDQYSDFGKNERVSYD